MNFDYFSESRMKYILQKLKDKIPTKVSELENDAGYTDNEGTVTQVNVGNTQYEPTEGVISLPAYPVDTDTHRPIEVNDDQILGNNNTPLNLKTGNNINFSTEGGDITISAVDTTYENKPAAEGGIAESLVTTGDKYNWNNKASNTPSFETASARVNVVSGDNTSTLWGKVKKYFTDLNTVAFTGDYEDLNHTPVIPTVNDAILKIQKNGVDVATFSANASVGETANITVPTKLSELDNDEGYTKNTGTVTSVNSGIGLVGGPITNSGTLKVKLKDETALENEALAIQEVAERVYPVSQDRSGNLAVSVPWTDTNTTYTPGSNVQIENNVISATDTTYENKPAAEGGLDVSLVTTGEKDFWNKKTSNVGTVTKVQTGTGLQGGDITTTGIIETYLSRVAKDSQTLPGANKIVWEEYSAGADYNLPSNAWYHIISMQGNDTKFGTQLALGMNTNGAYYRNCNNETWGEWKSLINTDSGGTVTSIDTGAGLIGGIITGSGKIKANLKTEEPSSLIAGERTSVENREYPVGLDANNKLSVNVPWDGGNVEIVDNLTTQDATKALSANQGYILNRNKANISDLGTAASKDVPTSGDASAAQVVLGSDSRLTDARNAADVSAWAKASEKPSYTATEVGAIPTTQKGANNGVAELDATGKVPSSQLPSFVDDVLEYDSLSSFPSTGEAGKIYVAKDTNKTYRWSGTAYVEISPSLALGETSSTAYRGDRGKTAYDHSQSTHARTDATAVSSSSTNGNIKINGTETTVYTHPGSGTNPHGTTKSDVGLGNVGNFKAVSTVASQGLSDTEKSNARANIGAGTSSFSGNYNDLTNKPTIPTVNNGTLTVTQNGTSKGTFTANQSGNATIALTDTTYSSKAAASGGTDVSLVTTGEKYTWNSKGNGTVTQVKVGSTAYNPTSGVVSLPAYPTVNNGTLTIQKNGTNVQTFTANQSSNATANITVPTKVSELTNDSGYTSNTGTVTSVATGTGLTGGTITGSGTISIASHSADYLAGGYINVHPENGPTLIPFMNNDIAYLLKRGGSAIVKYDGTQQSIDLTPCFDASPSYWAIDPTRKTTITIELVLHKVFAWTNTVYCDFGSAGWRAKNVKIEVMNTNYASDVWTQKYANTNLGIGHFYVAMQHTPVGASNAGGGFNRIRFTFSSWNNATIFRIAQLGVYNYSSAGLRETFLPKDGGNIYGTIYPNSNNGANLGTTSNYFNNAYITNINGVAVGSSPKFTDTNNRKSFYGTCDTAAATAAKVVTISDTNGWELRAGTIVGIKFTNSNTASNVTLNINNSGAKSIFYDTAVYTGNTNWITGVANKIIYYMYDGTNWAWLNFNWHSDGNNTVTQNSDTTTNSSFRILMSNTADDTNRTEVAKKSSKLTFNPSTGLLSGTITYAQYQTTSTRMDYGWNGINYFNANLTAGKAAKANDSPTTAWWHILRFNHGNSAGFYTDLAIPFNDTSLYYKRITSGAVQNNGWVKVYDALNLTSKAAAASGTDLSLVTTGEKATWNAKGSGTVTQVKVGTTAYNPSSGVISLPAYPSDTNNAVTQTNTATDAEYRVLFSSTADDTTRTEGARKSTVLRYNPAYGILSTNRIDLTDSLLVNQSSIEDDIIKLGTSNNVTKGYVIAGGISSGYFFSFVKTDTLISSAGSYSVEMGGNFTILPNIGASYFQLADGALYFVNIRVFSNSTPKGQLLCVYNRIVTAAHYHSSTPIIGSFADSSTSFSTYMVFTGYNGNQIRFETKSGTYAGVYVSFIRLN